MEEAAWHPCEGIIVADQIRIMCPNVVCRKIMTVPSAARGKVVQCPQCRKRIRIPSHASSTSHDEASSDESSVETPKKKAG